MPIMGLELAKVSKIEAQKWKERTCCGEAETEFYFHTTFKQYQVILKLYQLRIIERQTLQIDKCEEMK